MPAAQATPVSAAFRAAAIPPDRSTRPARLLHQLDGIAVRVMCQDQQDSHPRGAAEPRGASFGPSPGTTVRLTAASRRGRLRCAPHVTTPDQAESGGFGRLMRAITVPPRPRAET